MRLARFERARRELEAGRTLADVAHGCGFADQVPPYGGRSAGVLDPEGNY